MVLGISGGLDRTSRHVEMCTDSRLRLYWPAGASPGSANRLMMP
jgi:hypothetical protein